MWTHAVEICVEGLTSGNFLNSLINYPLKVMVSPMTYIQIVKFLFYSWFAFTFVKRKALNVVQIIIC